MGNYFGQKRPLAGQGSKFNLKESLKRVDVSNYDSFEDFFENVLDKDIKLLKDNSDICAPILTNIFNSYISNEVFPKKLKLADIIYSYFQIGW